LALYCLFARKIKALLTRYKQIVNYILGPILFIVLSYSIYQQLQAQPNLKETWRTLLNHNGKQQPLLLIGLLFLWVFNWVIEIFKWNFLSQKIEPTSFWQSTKAVLVGQAFAFNTFNNLGEALGRALCLQPKNRVIGGFTSVIGTLSIVLITILLGCVSSLFLSEIFPRNTIVSLGFSKHLYYIYISIALIVAAISFYWYYNINTMPMWLKKLAFGKANATKVINTLTLSKKDLTFLLLFSLIRFVVYNIQFVLTLKFLGIEALLIHITLVSFALFYVILIIPSIAFTELAVRGQISLYIIGLVSNNAVAIVSATTIFWLLNKVVPAMFGTLLAIKLRLYNTK
jgi:hypothetical protein